MRVLRPLILSTGVSLVIANACFQAPERDFTRGGLGSGGMDASAGGSSGGGSGGTGASSDASSSGGSSGGDGSVTLDGDVPDVTACTENAQCNDGNPCNGEETCSGGACVGGMPLADETACTVPRAVVVTSDGGVLDAGAADAGDAGNAGGLADAAGAGQTVIQTFPGLCFDGSCLQTCDETADCDDTDPCTGQETCDGARGVCVQGVAPTCEDANDCTEDQCHALGGNSMEYECTHELLDGDGDGHADEALGECGDDCNDDDDTVFTGAPEICDNMDNDCDGAIEPGAPYWYVDCDSDGFAEGVDNAVEQCDAPATAPGICGGAGQWVLTAPVNIGSTDCNDANESMFPGNPEICDGFDNDCSGLADDVAPKRWADCDGDGYAASGAQAVFDCDASVPPALCANGTWTTREPVVGSTDCNDANTAVAPWVNDCPGTDGVDDNCDGATDTYRWYRDCDNDGYAVSTSGAANGCTEPAAAADCAGGYTRNYPINMELDCDDENGLVYPYAYYQTTPDPEWGWDYNCDGEVSKQFTATEVADDASCVQGGGDIFFLGCSGTDGWSGTSVPECGETASWSICNCAPCTDGYICLFCSNGCIRDTGDGAQGCR